MKKGFTLVELIISVGLIALIAVMSIVFIVNRKDKTEDKTIALIKNSASVKYLSSAENVEEIKESFGFKAYKIDDLISEGLLEEKVKATVNKLKDKETDEVKKKYYDKVLLRYDYSNEGEGKIDYVYPLKPNENGMLFVVYTDSDTDYITFVANDFSSEYFKCNTGISEIGYIDSEYESNKITDATTIENNLSCKVVTDDSPFYDVELDHSNEEYNQEKAKYSNRVKFDDSVSEAKIQYSYKASDGKYYFSTDTRTIKLVKLSDLVLAAFNNGSKITDYDQYYKGSVGVFLYDEGKRTQVELNSILSGDPSWKYKNKSNEIKNIDTSTSDPVKLSENKMSIDVTKSATINGVSVNLSFLSGLSKALEFNNTIKVDNDKPQIVNLQTVINETDENKVNVSFTATDQHSGLAKILLKNKNGDEKDIPVTDTSSQEVSFEVSKDTDDPENWSIYLVDRVGNDITVEISDVPIAKVKSIPGEVYKFDLQVASAKKVVVGLDFPIFREQNQSKKCTEDGKCYDTNRFKEWFVDGVNFDEDGNLIMINTTYTFNFLDIVKSFYSHYNSRWSRWDGPPSISQYVLNNMEVDLIISVTGENDSVAQYKYKVKLNAYSDSGGFGGGFFSYSGWSPSFRGFNNNGDILFSEYCRKSYEILYLKKGTNGEVVQLLKAYPHTFVSSLTDKNARYGNYVDVSSKRYTSYRSYEYIYDLKKYELVDSLSWTSSYPIGNSKIDRPSNYANFERIYDKSYYSDMSDLLGYYKTIGRVAVTNPDRIFIATCSDGVCKIIFNYEDNWKGVITVTKFDSRVDYTMYYFKEEVSVSLINS